MLNLSEIEEKAKKVVKSETRKNISESRSLYQRLIMKNEELLDLCKLNPTKYKSDIIQVENKLKTVKECYEIYKKADINYDMYVSGSVKADDSKPSHNELGYPLFYNVEMTEAEREFLDRILDSTLDFSKPIRNRGHEWYVNVAREGTLPYMLSDYKTRRIMDSLIEKKVFCLKNRHDFIQELHLVEVVYPDKHFDLMSYRYSGFKGSYEEYAKNPDSEEETQRKMLCDDHIRQMCKMDEKEYKC